MARIRRFHRRGRGSIPRKGVLLDVVSLHLSLLSLFVLVYQNVMKRKCHSSALILTTDSFWCNKHFAGLAMTWGIVQLSLGIKYLPSTNQKGWRQIFNFKTGKMVAKLPNIWRPPEIGKRCINCTLPIQSLWVLAWAQKTRKKHICRSIVMTYRAYTDMHLS